jgi:hypothetical protein
VLLHLSGKCVNQALARHVGHDIGLKDCVMSLTHEMATVMSMAWADSHPWLVLLVGLAASAVALFSSRQDASLGATVGVWFSGFMSLFILVVFIVNALRSAWWIQAFIAAAGLCVEVWLLRRSQRSAG